VNTPDVSVVVRSMARPTLARTFASIAAQHGVEAEVIVVAARAVPHAAPARLGAHPLRMVVPQAPLDRGDAANAGMDVARGRYVTWLDDDDEWLPGHLAALLAAAASNPGCGLVHSLAEVRVDGEPTRSFGQPMARTELYQRNFIHVSTALVARALVAEGCRCDASLAVSEDWDWMLQCAHRSDFHFLRRRSFVWHAGIGESGAGGGGNHDAARVAAARSAIVAKWAPQRAQLVAALDPALARARGACERRDWPAAARAIGDALAVNANDPDALTMAAAVERAGGRLAEAQAAAALACVVRPHDASLVYNLALVCRERGDHETVRQCVAALERRIHDDPRASAWRAELADLATPQSAPHPGTSTEP